MKTFSFCTIHFVKVTSKRWRIFFFLLLAGWAETTFAQIDSVMIPDPDEYDWSSHLYLGAPFINNSIGSYTHLRNSLNQQGLGFARLQGNSMASYGFGIQKRRVKIGLDVVYGLTNSQTNKNTATKSRLGFQAFSVTLGYGLILRRSRQWFVNVGMGSQETRVNIYKTGATTPSVSFDDLLTSPTVGQSPTLLHKNTFLELSVEHMFRPKRPISFNPVVKFGYRYGTKPTSWGTDANLSFQNAPADRLNQFFVQSIFVLSKNYKKQTPAEKEARRKSREANTWGLNPQ